MKTIIKGIGIFGIIMLIVNLFFMNSASAQVTKTWNRTNGGDWKTASNWTPSGVPTSTDHVRIPGNQSGPIERASSNYETISLKGLTIDGNVNFRFNCSSGRYCTLNITETFTVAGGKTFYIGRNNSGRLNFTLASSATGTINGIAYMNGYTGSGYDRTFTNNGNLTIASAGQVSGQNTSRFSHNLGATLQIANTAGITISGATGAVRVPGTRTYNSGANYVYNGTASQVTGNGLTQNTPANLTINNGAGVTLSAVTTISGRLSMTNGTLNMANTNMSVGSITGTTNLTNSSGSPGARVKFNLPELLRPI